MGGLSFVHLGFLAAGAAVAVPIVIHLLFRQRARRVEIGSLFFLRLVLRDQARRRKVRRWLLLALRAAAMVLLALSSRDPTATPRSLAAPTARSFSSSIDRRAWPRGRRGRRRLLKAQTRAAEIVKSIPTGATVELAYFDADGVVPAAGGEIDRGLQPGLAGTDFTKALEWARDRVVASRRAARQLCLVTDLQRAGVHDPLAGSRCPPMSM